MKFLNFMEKQMDPFIKIELTDLAKTLAADPDMKVEFAFHSYYRPADTLATVSFYWDRLLDENKVQAMKSDIYLRALGNRLMTDYRTVNQYLNDAEELGVPSFARQLFALIEDLRLEKSLRAARPGMGKIFDIRKSILTRRYSDRYQVHKRNEEWLDLLFCSIYLQIQSSPKVLPLPLQPIRALLRELQESIGALRSTADTKALAEKMIATLSVNMGDMKSSYLTLLPDESSPNEEGLNFDDRDAATRNEDDRNENGEDPENEQMPSWKNENNESGSGLLQFDVDEGQNMDLMGEAERVADSGDQAFASMSAESQQSEGQEFDEAEVDHTTLPGDKGNNPFPYGEANKSAVAREQPPEPVSHEELEAYKLSSQAVEQIERPLRRSIQKTIEQKQIAPRTDQHFGRLGNKLLKILTDDHPRLFYKNNDESHEFDAAFYLLVDCSASMADKMDHTKDGLALFHKTLAGLKIPHQITGFWEDALSSDEDEQPNYFHTVIPFERSLLPKTGPEIMQLEPVEDNRDGFAIRKAADALRRRPEKHKILLVFTDGEPSAFDYLDNGIVDTKTAVMDTRKSGIETVGIFLATGEEQDREKQTLKNIYGRGSLIIPSLEEIPLYLTPLLKRLLLSYI